MDSALFQAVATAENFLRSLEPDGVNTDISYLNGRVAAVQISTDAGVVGTFVPGAAFPF